MQVCITYSEGKGGIGLIHGTLCCAGITPALQYATKYLEQAGFQIVHHPQWDATDLLLDVPSFRPGSPFTDSKYRDTILNALPRQTCIWGGNLKHDSLENFHTIDLLQNEEYLTKNAAITADCAISLATPLLHTSPQETTTLIIGWGRIGKHLATKLRDLQFPVTVAARSEADRYQLKALGYDAADTHELRPVLSQFRLIFNTVPAIVLTKEDRINYHHCIRIELASTTGIDDDDVIVARGLPGIYAPEASGQLIAETFLKLKKEMRN